MTSIDTSAGLVAAVVPVDEWVEPVPRERLICTEQFGLWRLTGRSPSRSARFGEPRVLVSLDRDAELDHDGDTFRLQRGEVIVLPSVVGTCVVRPLSHVTVLELSLSEVGAR